jgi:hypothetical protein
LEPSPEDLIEKEEPTEEDKKNEIELEKDDNLDTTEANNAEQSKLLNS